MPAPSEKLKARKAEIETIDLSEQAKALSLEMPETNPVLAFQDPQRFDDFLGAMRQEIAAAGPHDVTTKKGRDAIVSLAFKCTKAKTALDAAGKQLTEDARDQIAKVDAARRRIRTELDQLADEVRAPVTEWERREAARQKMLEQSFAYLRNAPVVLASDTSEDVEAAANELSKVRFDPEMFQDRLDEALSLQTAGLAALSEALVRLRQEESDRAELEQLRKDKAEADQREQLRLQAEREAALQRQREKDELAAAKAREAQQTLDAKRRAEEEKARQKLEAEREKQRQQDLADAREQAAKDAIAKAEQAAQREALARQQEADRRAADTANRKRVTDAVTSCLVLLIDKKQTPTKIAQAITAALVEGVVPHVTLRF
jgi:colicin import membrane protein